VSVENILLFGEVAKLADLDCAKKIGDDEKHNRQTASRRSIYHLMRQITDHVLTGHHAFHVH
jgi:hypothetical protein